MTSGGGSDERGPAVLGLLCVAQFIDVLGVTIVIVALPSIRADLEAGAQATQWVVSAYALCFGGLLVLAGRVADAYGRRRLFTGGLAAFAAASLACGLAPSIGTLLVARAAQGVAAAAVVPAALALLTATFAEGPRRTRALAVWTAAAAGGGAAGFLLGGLLTDLVGWRWLFLLNVPVAVAAALLAVRLLAESRGGADARMDVGGAVLATAGLAALIGGLTVGADRGLADPAAFGPIAAGVLLLASFARVERRVRAPLLPPALARSPAILSAAATAFALTASTGASAVLITAHLQEVLGRSPAATGLAFLPFSALVVVGSLAGPRLVGLGGARAAAAGGLGTVAAASLLYLLAGEEGGVAPVVAALAISGAALGCASVAATTIGMAASGGEDDGVAAGLLNTATQLGTATGVALIGAIAAARTSAAGGNDAPAAVVAGLHAGWIAAALTAAAGALLVGALARRL